MVDLLRQTHRLSLIKSGGRAKIDEFNFQDLGFAFIHLNEDVLQAHVAVEVAEHRHLVQELAGLTDDEGEVAEAGGVLHEQRVQEAVGDVVYLLPLLCLQLDFEESIE